ncbi:MAG: DUF4267 domain-containing protein [Ktedonobacterales bacterium]|jgi:hypothetical protein
MRNLLNERRARQLAAGLGLGLLVFGAVPVIAPRPFARIFGFDAPTPEAAAMSRSIGARDVAMGAALWAAAARGGSYAPWLLARAVSDGGDALAIGIAAAQGKRNARFLSLGGLALAATLADAALWTLARRAGA